MLSLGTEVFLAFCTASTRVGLPERSAPPILAATSMFLMSLAKDLARRESMTAFLCFVVAHLEWPDMPPVYAGPGAAIAPFSRDDLGECAQVAVRRAAAVLLLRQQPAER